MNKNDFTQVAVRVSSVSIIGNLILSIFKFIAGILGHSTAMISDAVHSASDVFSSIIVIIGVKIAAKDSDPEHPYGHERLECVAAIVLATILAVTGLGIAKSAFDSIYHKSYQSATLPGLLALAAAIISILSKEAMFWYTRYHAKQINSAALAADAWHHRSDALSSVGALIGIGGARLGYAIFEPIASLIICIFIASAAYEIFVDAVNKMVDHSCDPEIEQQIYQCVLMVDGVRKIDLLNTRMFGNKIYVDLEISADASRPLRETHAIAENVHNSIEQQFPVVKHIMVHVNPLED